jgi:ADP-ribose pyrophosphatase
MKKVYSFKDFIKIYNYTAQQKKIKIENFHKIVLRNTTMLICENNKKKILLLKEYRHGLGKFSWGFPGGAIDKNEKAKVAAKREFLEETGILLDKIELLFKYVRDGNYFCGREYVFVAKVKKENKLKLEKNCTCKWVKKSTLSKMISSGLLETPGVVAAALFYLKKFPN